MRLAQPAGLLLLLLAVPIVVLHLLKPRREAVAVSSTWLWRSVARPATAARPWQRLRPSLLLLLQLLAVAALALAAAKPVRLTDVPLAEHTVFIVDVSGSMAATDGEPDRLGTARQRAVELRRQVPDGGVASIVVAGPQPRVALSASADPDAFADALRSLEAGAGGADVAGAFALAESLEVPGTPIGFVLLSDGGIGDARRLVPPGTRYVAVGERDVNRAIVRLGAEPRGSGLHVRASIAGTGGPAATQEVRFDVDGRTVATERVRIPAGERVEVGVDVPAGDRVEAFLEGEDLLAADDHAYAVAARRRTMRVLVAGPPDPYLDALVGALPGVVVERSAEPRPAPGFDVAIYDRVAVPEDPGAPFLAIAPPGGAAGLRVAGEVERPALALVRTEDPLLEGLDLSEVGIAKAQRLEVGGDEVLVGAEGAPLLVRGARGGRPFAYLSFALADSNLPLQVAWPLLADRLLAELAGATVPPAPIAAGSPLPVQVAGALTVRAPGGLRLEVAPGGQAPVADRPGFWVVEEPGRPPRTFAVVADPEESRLRPVPSLPVRPRQAAPGERRPAGEVSLLPLVAGLLLVILVAELLLSRRKRGVPLRRWRAALAVRAVMAACVALAALGVALPTRGDGVATVFLVDASDSMGSAGRQAALAWVRDALRAQPRGARAGVALFGGDARLELTVRERAELVQAGAIVDPSRTDLAAGLRLAAAVLPSDSRRRVVVVSDGRVTDGDARSEAARLREQGVRVDVHTVSDVGAGGDVAVARLDAPQRARAGEEVVLRAVLVSTASGPARLVLRRDGAVVDERAVTLVPGEQVVEIPQVVSGEGVARFQVAVTSAGDPVEQNDSAHAAVEVEGPARVLVVEGATGAGEQLAAALAAGGIGVERVPPAGIPALDRLAAFDATVLVDVDARALADAQVGALAAAVRDLGRGLVAVGGDRSYGLGGYLGSRLEELLPVESDVKDPKRRASVAEVLAIDTSGSMGTCHCAEGAGANGMAGGGNRADGGVDKTDISRAAAARTIRALQADDEVGVLAFNTEQRFVIPLQKVPAEDVVRKGLRGLKPEGGTDLRRPLQEAAEALRKSSARLKHIILFTDGFTDPGGLEALVAQARDLRAGGITVSVLATGEGASEQLRAVAEAGGGRFYPGRDLAKVPEIMAEEARVASRSFVNEGEFLPEVTSAAPAVRDLTSAPAILGFIATTARPTADVALRIGDDRDPLLASWQVGLGRASAWTSDASLRWSQRWAAWGGYVPFWTAVVKDVLPGSSGGAAVRAEIRGGDLRVRLEGEAPFPDGATAVARIARPGMASQEVRLERASATAFEATVPAGEAGTYAVGAEVRASDGSVVARASALAAQSYPAEYRPGSADPALLREVSERSGGRGEITPGQAFDRAGLVDGAGRVPLAGWLLLLAALLWPVDVALRRLAPRGALTGADGSTARRGRGAALLGRLSARRRAGAERGSPAAGEGPPATDAAPGAEPPPAPAEEAAGSGGSLGALLAAKRDRSQRG